MRHLMRVLNLDDNEIVRYTRGQILRRAGFEVTDACTGAEALDIARQRRFEVALLDVKLPDMSGFDVTRQIRRSPKTRSMRIAQISAVCTDAGDEMAGLENGADIYLRHPFDTRDLPGVVSGLASGSTRRARPRRAQKKPRDVATAHTERELAYADLMSVAAEIRALHLEAEAEPDKERAVRLSQQFTSLQASWEDAFARYSTAYQEALARMPRYPDMCRAKGPSR